MFFPTNQYISRVVLLQYPQLISQYHQDGGY